jgi:hypothetical protein
VPSSPFRHMTGIQNNIAAFLQSLALQEIEHLPDFPLPLAGDGASR